MSWLASIITLVLAFWLIARFYLRGADHSGFEFPQGTVPNAGQVPSQGHQDAVAGFKTAETALKGLSQRQMLHRFRQGLDDMGKQVDLTNVSVTPADINGVPGEWVMADGADPNRRVLYLHGGAFTAGSPLSHRGITAEFSRIIGAAVLVPDYRLMPEHRRLEGLTDCRTAYRWVLDNGPQGHEQVKRLVVAGDSAGGNLTLVVVAWARDTGLRAPDAVVALSPGTDGTMSGTSITENISTDHMLGPLFARFSKIPRSVALWFGWLNNRVRPCHPDISPLHGDLSNLPPTLIQASHAEILRDDAIRYTNKARAAGSNVTLECWADMLHVWHAFVAVMPEAQDAFARIKLFLLQQLEPEDNLEDTRVIPVSPLAEKRPKDE